MYIEFVFSRSRKYFRQQLARAANEETLWPRTIGQVLLAGAVLVPVVLQGSRVGIEAGVVLLVVGGLVLAAAVRRRHRLVRVPDSWLGERRWLLTGDYLESGTPHTFARHGWSQLRLTRVHPNSYVLTTTDGVVVDIPREPVGPADDAQLRAFLDRLPLSDAAPVVAEPLTGEGTTIEFTSSQPSQPIGTRLVSLHRRRFRWAAFRYVVAGLALLVFGLIAAAVFDDGIFVLISAAAAAVPLITAVRLWSAGRRTPRDPVGTPRRFTITDQALQVNDAGRSVRWNWSIVKRLQEWPETYVLSQDGGFPFVIPRDTLTRAQEQALRALLHDQGLITAHPTGQPH